MGQGFRSVLRLVATAAAAAAVARAAESARQLLNELAIEPPPRRELRALETRPLMRIVDPVPVPPVSGAPVVAAAPARDPVDPTPDLEPSRGVGFRAPPETAVTVDELEASGELDADDHRSTTTRAPEPADEQAAEPPVVSPIDRLLARRHASDPAPVPPTSQPTPEDGPHRVSARDEPAPAPPRPKGQHRRTTGAVSGTVTNVYAHGLRGLRVEVVDDAKQVVATAVTGSKGAFVVDDVPDGTYRLRAFDDLDDDFERAWHGGSTFAEADAIKVRADKTRRGVDVVLRSNAQIDVDVTVTETATEIVVAVTHRATGAPATGEIEVRSKDVELSRPLTDGKVALALETVGKKLRVDYLGDHQTRPASVKVRLR